MIYSRSALSLFCRFSFFLTLLLLSSAYPSRGGEPLRSVLDATGKKTELVEKPQRIVTLAPSLGELAAEFVGSDLKRIVGVSEYTDYPPALKQVVSIGSYVKVNIEKVVALKPDLVLATLDGNSKDQVLQLRELGLPVIVIQTENFHHIQTSMKHVALAIGVPEKGTKMAFKFQNELSRLREKAKQHSSLRVMLQMGENPIIVAGGKSFLQDAMEVIGAKNAYTDLSTAYPRPSVEDVLKRNPDAIVVLAFGQDLKPFQRMALRWQEFKDLTAVQTHRIQVVQSDALLRPTLRMVEGLNQLGQVLYGKF